MQLLILSVSLCCLSILAAGVNKVPYSQLLLQSVDFSIFHLELQLNMLDLGVLLLKLILHML